MEGAGAGLDTGAGIRVPNPWGRGMDTEGKCGKEGWVVGCDDNVAPVVGFDGPPSWEEDAWATAAGSLPGEVDFAAPAWFRLPRRVNGRFATPISCECCETSMTLRVSARARRAD